MYGEYFFNLFITLCYLFDEQMHVAALQTSILKWLRLLWLERLYIEQCLTLCLR